MVTVWDDRLISRHRAADMCGTWQVKVDHPYLRCADCDMNILKLPSGGSLIDVDGIIAAVVRHMTTTAHGYSLSGSGNVS